MPDKKNLEKSTIFLGNGNVKEAERTVFEYEVVDEKQKKIQKLFEIRRIIQIVNGRNTKNFKRFQTKNKDKLENSFSIMFKDRSIDLEALSKADKDKFLNSLIFLMQNIDFKRG